MECKDHPKYGGLRTPRSDCKGCWEVYNEKKASKSGGEAPSKPAKEEAGAGSKSNNSASDSTKLSGKKAAVALPNDTVVELKTSDKTPSKKTTKSNGDKVESRRNKKSTRPSSEGKKTEKTTSTEGHSEANRSSDKREDAIASEKEIIDQLRVRLDKTIGDIVSEITDRKLSVLRNNLAREMNMEWEHIFVTDDTWHPNMLKPLEEEGWQWMSHSWPLAEKGIIPGQDYHLLKRLKNAGQKKVPDFTDSKTVKRYGGTVVNKNQNNKKK